VSYNFEIEFGPTMGEAKVLVNGKELKDVTNVSVGKGPVVTLTLRARSVKIKGEVTR